MLKIEVTDKASESKRLRPIDAYNKPEGKVYRMFQQPEGGVRLKESHPSYLLTTGYNDYPILIFYSDNKYRMSPCDKKELEEYLPNVWIEEVNAEVSMSININGLA